MWKKYNRSNKYRFGKKILFDCFFQTDEESPFEDVGKQRNKENSGVAEKFLSRACDRTTGGTGSRAIQSSTKFRYNRTKMLYRLNKISNKSGFGQINGND